MEEINIDVKDFSILLVEPSATQRKIITNHLMLSQVKRVDVVASVEEALLYLETGSGVPDLVICAMYFSNMSGKDLVIKMKNNQQLQDVPFMLLSSEEQQDTLYQFRQAGIVAFLPKPFTITQLQHALDVVHEALHVKELELEVFEVDAMQILIVDDSSISRQYIKHFLYNMGFNYIFEAANATQALAKLKNEDIDLLIVDQEMPNITGTTLVTKLKQIDKFTPLPVIMVTSININSLENTQQAGISAVLQKPINPKEFRKCLKNVLEH